MPIFVILSSLFLYIAGIATGWFIGQSYYHSTNEKISSLEQEITGLRTLADSPGLCSYSEARYSAILDTLTYFWQGLPYRLESADVPKDTLSQYTNLEAEAYATGKLVEKNCGKAPRVILYFFKRNTNTSQMSGRILDDSKGKFTVLAFPVDIDSPVVNALMSDVGVFSLPAIHLCGKTINWPFNSSEVIGAERLCK